MTVTLSEQVASLLDAIQDGHGGMVEAEYVVDTQKRCLTCGIGVEGDHNYCPACAPAIETCPVCGRPANHDWQECAQADYQEWKAAQADRAAVLAEL